MLIRCQDENKRVEISGLCIDVDISDDEYDGKYEICASSDSDTYWTLGKYTSRNKAFKVMNMIDEAYNQFESGFNIEVFQMPKDKDVEV